MEESAVVLMLKEADTGFLTKEMGCYSVDGNVDLLFQIFVQEDAQAPVVHMGLTCAKELEDWEYDAVFDYYDTEVFQELADTILEEDGHLNPVWMLTFAWSDEPTQMAEKLSKILAVHEQELRSVYEAIADKKDDYIEK